jgi:phage tail sheath protein FI
MGAVNLLCLPVAATLGSEQGQLIEDAVNFCEVRHAFLVVDPPVGPAGASAPAMTSWCAGGDGPPASSHAAVYWPRLLVPDASAPGLLREIGPSGTVAGIMARIDAGGGVWRAPAGTGAAIQGAEVAVSVKNSDIGELSRASINAVRSLPVVGDVVWGARTLVPADSEDNTWKYVPVRRTAVFLEVSLLDGLQHAVFEPNDQRLWSQVRLTVGSFLHDLYRRQAFQGATPSDAYFVQCGHDTMTQTDIDQGLLNVIVGFAPLKPAEFVVLRIRVRTAQQQPE